jgi:RND family efflux transporter MFP subunit
MFTIRSHDLVWWLLAAVSLSHPLLAASSTGVRAVTRPSADITLSFVQPGRIAQVSFQEGDAVKAGDILVRQDDVAEQVAQSEDLTQVKAAEASLAQKKVDLEKLQKAAASNAATFLEVEHAKLDVTIAELSLELARFEHEQAGRKYEEQRIRVDRMQLKSPIDGRIEKIDVEVGESADALADCVRVVRIDPLWIDAPVPCVQASGLKTGMTARVQFSESDNANTTSQGRVIFVGSVADAASDTLRVRIEVANKTARAAGEHVLVTFAGDEP